MWRLVRFLKVINGKIEALINNDFFNLFLVD